MYKVQIQLKKAQKKNKTGKSVSAIYCNDRQQSQRYYQMLTSKCFINLQQNYRYFTLLWWQKVQAACKKSHSSNPEKIKINSITEMNDHSNERQYMLWKL